MNNVSPRLTYQKSILCVFPYFIRDSLPFPVLSKNIYSSWLPTYTIAWSIGLMHQCSEASHFPSGDRGGLRPSFGVHIELILDVETPRLTDMVGTQR